MINSIHSNRAMNLSGSISSMLVFLLVSDFKLSDFVGLLLAVFNLALSLVSKFPLPFEGMAPVIYYVRFKLTSVDLSSLAMVSTAFEGLK